MVEMSEAINMNQTSEVSSITSSDYHYSIKYLLIDYWDQISDPRNRHYPLISGGPSGVLSIIIIYLWFTTKLGPDFMQNRQPYKLRYAMMVYNFMMVLFNFYFFVESVYCLNWGIECFNLVYPPRDDVSAMALRRLRAGYLYFISKILDLTDTVFFVLRKKDNQVTGLHLYHHSMMPFLAWMALIISPTSGPCGLFPLINSVVHILMYSYYGLAAFGPHVQRYLWWKKHITILQLSQFIVLFVFACYFIAHQKGYPMSLFCIFGFPQPILFFIMFLSFYQNAYLQNNNKLKGN